MKNIDYLTKGIFPAVICHILTFFCVMVVIPLFCRGWRDVIWVSLRITGAAVLAVIFTARYPDMNPVIYFFLSVVQDLMGFILRPQLSRIYGIPLTPLGEFEYIGQVFVWITGIVILQMIVITTVRQFNTEKK